MVILIRSNDANPDPRVQKYINYLQQTQQRYMVIAWNRDATKIEKDHTIFFHLQTGYGLEYKNIPYKMAWFLFVMYQLFKHRKAYQLIHACDLDTMIPAYFFNLWMKKKLVFDVFDWVSNMDSKGIFKKMIAKIENKLFKRADYTILCEPYRIEQVQEKCRRDYFVLPNIPDIDYVNNPTVEHIIYGQREQYKVILSYVGVFDDNRGIQEVLEFVSIHQDFCLNIAGFGQLESVIRNIAAAHDNIVYWGKVDYNFGLNIMKHSDLILAFYYVEDDFHKYAAPNKYYEGLFLGKAILTNTGTEVATKTLAHNTGFVIQEGVKALEQFFQSDFQRTEMAEKNNNALTLWGNSFVHYTEQFMHTSYQTILNS